MDKSVRNKKTSPAASTQLYLNISEIRDDVVVLKSGAMRAVLQTSSVNFNLKSEAEQEAIIISYQGFLNTLEFPIQIVIRSRKLDVMKYLDMLDEASEKQENPLLKKQTLEYREYIKKLVEYADIMEKIFYVVVPIDPFGTKKTGLFSQFVDYLSPRDSIAKIRQRRKEFEQVRKKLMQRVGTVKTGLTNCNLRVNQLNTKELVELYYNIYNPITARNEKLPDLEDLEIAQGG